MSIPGGALASIRWRLPRWLWRVVCRWCDWVHCRSPWWCCLLLFGYAMHSPSMSEVLPNRGSAAFLLALPKGGSRCAGWYVWVRAARMHACLVLCGSHPSYLVGEFRRFVYHIRRSVDGCFCVADATSARHSRSRRRCGHHALPCSSVYSPYRRGIGVGTQRPNGARRTVGKRQCLAASVRLSHGIHPLDSALVSPRRHFKRFHGGALLRLHPANQP